MGIMEPYKIKNVLFQNRVVMAPMVPFGMPQLPSGVMSNTLKQHYLDRAKNGMGLMISQSMSVTKKRQNAGGASIYANEHVDNLRDIASACHEHGTKLFVQLAYPSDGHQNGESINMLTAKELEEITDEFAKAAHLCKVAGCDGIELHGAHGYFLNMFTSVIANERTDNYGGDLEGRLYLVRNIIDKIGSFLDEDFIVSYRMGLSGDGTMDIQTAQALEALGVEMLHVSSGIPASEQIKVPENFPYNSIVFSGTEIKKHVNIPVIAVNDIRTINRGNELLDKELCDFVAYGKPFLADHLFLSHSIDKVDYQSCFCCKTCFWFSNYTLCPALKKSKEL